MKLEIEMGEDKDEGMEEKEYGPYDKFEIQSAARVLMEAEEIKADKEKMKYVAQCMKDKADNIANIITSLDDLKKLANKKT